MRRLWLSLSLCMFLEHELVTAIGGACSGLYHRCIEQGDGRGFVTIWCQVCRCKGGVEGIVSVLVTGVVCNVAPGGRGVNPVLL